MEKPKTVELLMSLDNFSDPVGPAAQLQTERLMKWLRKQAIENPTMTYRLDEERPEQTAAEILAGFDAEDAEIEALRNALKKS